MVYVERLPEEQQMASGLFLPTKANPRMHVCKVSRGCHRKQYTVVPPDLLLILNKVITPNHHFISVVK